MQGRSARTAVLALTSVASLMVALDILIVTTALGPIRVGLGASVEQLEWTVNAYNLTFAALLMTASALADRYGRRRMFILGMALFSLASVGCALAPDVTWLVVFRMVQGVGAAVVMPVSVALISATFPPGTLGRAMGVYSGVTGLATVGGPLIGGAVTEALGWQWIFWLNVPIGLVVIPLAFSRIQESRGPDTALDVPGVVLVTFAAFGVVWGLIRANAAGWGGSEVIGTLTIGSLFAVAFVPWELRSSHPMLPMGMFADRAFSLGNVVTFVLFAQLFASVFLMAQFLQTVLGSSPFESGVMLIPWTATLLLVAPVAGALADRYGTRPVLAAALTLTTVGMGWLAVVAEPGRSYWAVALPLVIGGVGNSAAIPVVQAAVVGSVGPNQLGKAAGANGMIRELGGVFGIAILIAVFAAAGGYASPENFTDGFSAAIAGCAVLGLVGAVAALAMPGARPADHPAAPRRAPKTESDIGRTRTRRPC